MADLASVDDLATLMKRPPFTGDDLDQATLVIQIVSAWARGVSGQQWPDAPTGVPPDVRAVVLTASRRELNNPDKAITETMGPFNVTYMTPPEGFFTIPELAILRKFSGRPAGLFTVSMSRGDVPTAFSDGYLTMDGGGELLPYYGLGDPGWGYSEHFNQGF